MCHEVDDFVSQDTVKYVENQVQTVGESVKKFCSDVVQDLLPPLVDPLKPEAQAVSLKQNDAIGTYISEPGLVKQIIPMPPADPPKEAESDLPLGQDDDASICKKLDMCLEEIIAQGDPSPFEELKLVSPENKDSCGASLLSESVDENHENGILAVVSPETFVRSAVLESTQKEGMVCDSSLDEVEFVSSVSCGASLFSESVDENHKNGILAEVSPETFVHGAVLESTQKEGTVCDNSLDEVEYVSDVSSTLPSSQLALPVVSSENKTAELGLSSSGSSLSTGSHSLPEFSHANFSQKAEKVECVSDVSSTLPSPQLALSVVFSENKTAEMGLGSSSSSLSTVSSSSSSFSTGSHSLPELSHSNFSQKAEEICYNPVNSIGCLSDLSGTPSSFDSLPIISCDNKVVDVGLSFSSSVLSLESNDEVVSLDGSPGNRCEHCCECTQLEAFMSSLEIGEAHNSRVDIADPSLETIELSDEVKLDRSCVFVDDKSLYAVTCRARKLRSYKKIIQDAFASKKRLRKEYEQLAIWYGDVDIESSQHPEQNLLPSFPSTCLDSKKSSAHDICDSEWELV
ncbi:hypothetical protein F0562_000037 [Nyssa sinensis]|uniref:Uncharacterized protein n=1 Tax=Nyssa sinensis TaxID=561372 RepID=A0A5J5BYT6_9ASTE|nr:hypothetical protein F0562_000037 [Nyssa sinensis]